jgi:hypothetical protein
MRKGDLVKFNKDNKHVQDEIDRSSFEVISTFRTTRPTTLEEKEEWRTDRRQALDDAITAGEDTFSIAFNDAGESRLCPDSTVVDLPIENVFIVEKARCKHPTSTGRFASGFVKIIDTTSGESTYVRKETLEVI